jgi:hypothetical protein
MGVSIINKLGSGIFLSVAKRCIAKIKQHLKIVFFPPLPRLENSVSNKSSSFEVCTRGMKSLVLIVTMSDFVIPGRPTSIKLSRK